MSYENYEQLFMNEIEGRLRAGGDPTYMVALVKIYEAEDSHLKKYAFLEWARGIEFVCEKCRRTYKPDSLELSPWDDVLCPRCAQEAK